MMRKIFIALILLAMVGCTSPIPEEVCEQHAKHDDSEFMTFTFIGVPKGFSKETYMTPHGEYKGLEVEIEKVFIGSYSKKTVEFGMPVNSNFKPDFEEKYYMTAGWGTHGMILFEETKINNHNQRVHSIAGSARSE